MNFSSLCFSCLFLVLLKISFENLPEVIPCWTPASNITGFQLAPRLIPVYNSKLRSSFQEGFALPSLKDVEKKNNASWFTILGFSQDCSFRIQYLSLFFPFTSLSLFSHGIVYEVWLHIFLITICSKFLLKLTFCDWFSFRTKLVILRNLGTPRNGTVISVIFRWVNEIFKCQLVR